MVCSLSDNILAFGGFRLTLRLDRQKSTGSGDRCLSYFCSTRELGQKNRWQKNDPDRGLHLSAISLSAFPNAAGF